MSESQGPPRTASRCQPRRRSGGDSPLGLLEGTSIADALTWPLGSRTVSWCVSTVSELLYYGALRREQLTRRPGLNRVLAQPPRAALGSRAQLDCT